MVMQSQWKQAIQNRMSAALDVFGYWKELYVDQGQDVNGPYPVIILA